MKKYLYTIAVALSTSVIISFCLYNGYLWFVYPDKTRFPVFGIDVSHHQGSIDWKKVKDSGVSFAYLKATEGDDLVDKKLEENYFGAKTNTIPVGIYHFYSLRISPEAQLKNITNTLSGKTFDLPIVVDLEFGGNSKIRPSVEVFQKDLSFLLAGIEKYQSRKPILYVTYEFNDSYLSGFKKYPIWIRDIIKLPDENFDWIIWQYKNRGHINGIDGFVDLNVLSGSIDKLLK